MLNVTNIPAPRVPFVDERTGLMAREWYRFFLNLFVLTGSGSNPTSLDELQIGPPNQADALIDITKSIQGAYLNPTVQTGTIASFNLDGSPTAGGIAYGTGPALAVSAAGTTGQVLTSNGAGTPTWATDAGGTVTSVSVVSANGLAGTVATATTTPAITLSTTVTGVVKGNGTTLSAAVAATDYVAPSAYASANGLTLATVRLLGRTTASTGAAEEISVAGGLTLSSGTLTGTSGTVTAVSVVSANGLAGSSSGGATPALTLSTTITGVLKGNGTAISAATSGTDYAPATSGTSILYGNGAGGFSNVVIGTGVSFVGGTLSATGASGTVTSVSGAGSVNGLTLTGTVTTSGSITLGGAVSGNIIGTTTNDNAPAGSYGEYIESVISIASGVALTTDTMANVTSISLTAGDWDVNGWVGFRAGGATTITYLRISISVTSAALNQAWQAGIETAMTANAVDPSLHLGSYRQSLSGTTTIYLIANAGFAVSTLKAFGVIRARRVR